MTALVSRRILGMTLVRNNFPVDSHVLRIPSSPGQIPTDFQLSSTRCFCYATRSIIKTSRPNPDSRRTISSISKLLPQTFPKKTRNFLNRQEELRKIDGLPRGVELVYLLPQYRANFLRISDMMSVLAMAVGSALIAGYIVWNEFLAGDEGKGKDEMEKEEEESAVLKEKEPEFDFYYDDQGRKWKKRKIDVGPKFIDNKWVAYFQLISCLGFFMILRLESARTPLRMYTHPSLLRYYAVFPRHWRKNRVVTFTKNRVNLRHGKFLILTVEGSHYTLPNKVAQRHFRDDESAAVFMKIVKKDPSGPSNVG